MGQQTVTSNTNTQLFVDTDTSQIFLGHNHTRQEVYINNSYYDPITLEPGTVMGRIGSTGIVIPWTSVASDGSQNVLGLLGNKLVIDAGDTIKASIVVAGKVAQEKVKFYQPNVTLDTVVSNRQVRDKIAGETVGVWLVQSFEMTDFDNS